MRKLKLSGFKKRYDALLPLPDYPGEMNWVLRVSTWNEFANRGNVVADHLEILFNGLKEKYGDKLGKEYYDEDFRSLHPALHDLLMQAYGKTEVLRAWRKP